MQQEDRMTGQPQYSRRRFLAHSSLADGAVVSAAWLNQQVLFSQAPPARIKTESQRGKVSVLKGSGGNIAVLTSKDGKVIVDSGFRAAKPQIGAALNALSADPITHLINTDWHNDHTDGNEWMHAAGEIVLAHVNTNTRLSATQTVAAWQMTFPPAPAGAIPSETFTDRKTLHLNGTTLELAYYRVAHTDTDISILLHRRRYPALRRHMMEPTLSVHRLFDLRPHHWHDSSHRAQPRGKHGVYDHHPGHGRGGNRAQLTEYHNMLITTRDKAVALKKQGNTPDEVVAAKLNAAYDAKLESRHRFSRKCLPKRLKHSINSTRY
jgi:glyoxylase-like metal-dependent hydrolase (beta-lactamase superfamily II)